MATGWQKVRLGRRGRWGLAAAIVAGGVVAGWVTLPDVGLRWGLIRTLRDFGMVDVSIADSALSLFDGHLMVRDMIARAPLDGSSALGIGDLALRFRWGPLFSKRVAIDHLALTGVAIDLRRDAGSDVFVLNGLPLALSGDPPATADQPAVPAATARPWGIDLAELDLTDSRLHFTSGALSADIAISRLIVTNLHSQDPDRPVAFTLDGSLNGAPLHLSGTVLPFADAPSFTLSLAASGIDLGLFQQTLAEIGVAGIKGSLEVTASVEGRLTAAGPAVTGSGRAEIASPRLAEPVRLTGDRLSLTLDQASWNGSRVDLVGQMSASGLAAAVQPVSVSASSLRLEAASARWEGRQGTWQGDLTADSLAVKGAGVDIAAASLRLEAAPARLDGRRLTWEGKLDTANLALTEIDPSISAATATWTGKTEANGAAAIRAEGRLDIESARLNDREMTVSLGKASAEGRIETTPDKAVWPVGAQLRLAADKISATATRGARDWLAANRIEAADLTVTGAGELSAAKASIEGLAALRRGGPAGYPWRVEARSLRLDHPAYRTANKALSAGQATVAGLTLRLTRTEIGLLGFSFPSSGAPAAAAEPPFGFALGRIDIGEGSRVMFEDRSLDEPVRLVANPVDLTLSRLDSAHPDRDIPFDLAATVGNARATATGALRPFAAIPGGTVEARVTALELPPLSPYLADVLGVHLRTGHFDGTVRGEARQGELNGQIDLTLSNLFIADPDPNAPLARKVGMPIETMLDLLRGGDDRIRLSIPVRGQLDSPDFDISDAVTQAVAGAVSSTVMATLKVAFPLTALISLVTDLGEGNHLALAPLAFPAGSAALSDDQHQILDQVATLMRGRDSLRLTLCGKAALGEGQALALRRRAEERPLLSRLERLIGSEPAATGLEPADRDALIALANRRAAAAKSYLSEQGGIAPERLFTCRGVIEDGEGKGPRVDLLL